MMNQELCSNFFEFPTRNPINKKTIKVDGPTYKKIKDDCDNLENPDYKMKMVRSSSAKSKKASASKATELKAEIKTVKHEIKEKEKELKAVESAHKKLESRLAKLEEKHMKMQGKQ